MSLAEDVEDYSRRLPNSTMNFIRDLHQVFRVYNDVKIRNDA